MTEGTVLIDTDIFNKEKVQNKLKNIDTEIVVEDVTNFSGLAPKKQVVVMDDGSFITITTEVTKLSEETDVEAAKSFSALNTISSSSVNLGDYRATYAYKISHALYPDTKLVLNTDYKVEVNKVTITGTTTTGTGAIWPNSVSSSSKTGNPSVAQLSGTGSKAIYSYGEYTYKLFGVKDIVVVYQKDYEIKCKIGVGFIDGDVATYTINHYIN